MKKMAGKNPFKSAFAALFLMATSTTGEAANDGVNLPKARADAATPEQKPQFHFKHLKVRDTIGDLLNHPAFNGFAELILPRADRAYDVTLPLNNMAALMPYHSDVRPDVSIQALNRMIDDVSSGDAVFFDIYTPEQKQDDPSKRQTGLFFFRGRPGAPFAVIAPGGGFSYVGSLHEGFPYADAISKHGYNAFVLKYRTGRGGQVATQDLAAAISYILANKDALSVGGDGYSVWGSSAGARMAAYIGSHGVAAFGGDDLPKPATVVMAYTGHSDITTTEPPTFVIVGAQDAIAPPSAMESRVTALRNAGVEVDYRVYPNVAHGFGLGVGTTAEGWLGDAVRFWAKAMDH